MEIIEAQNLTFQYPNSHQNALDSISFSVAEGEFVVLCGRSGCGKSTLLRQLKPLLAPYGKRSGAVFFRGNDICSLNQEEQCKSIGFVMQTPEPVTDKVWHELSFGLESLGMQTPQIRARVAEISAFFGIENWFHKRTAELSGGEKQLLALAAVMVMQPSLLLLDEPTSSLDPISADRFFETLSKINRELGTAIVLAEHRLNEAIPLADKVIVMDKGTITASGTPGEVGKALFNEQNPMAFAMPVPMRVYYAAENDANCPVTVREGREWLMGKEINRNIELSDPPLPETDTSVEVRDIRFRYEKNLPDILKGVSLKVNSGEIYALLGGNGAGKTTLISVICGLLTPYCGKTEICGKTAMLPQNSEVLFTKKTVELDLSAVCPDREKITKTAQLCEISDLLQRHPYDLSGGELERAAIAKILLTDPRVLLLDEPTKGADAEFKKKFADILFKLKEKGVTIILVSHDIEFCAEYADRCGMIFDGQIASEGRPREFFGGKSFYTTAANRMSRGIIDNAVTADDIIGALGTKPAMRKSEPAPHQKHTEQKETDCSKIPQARRKLSIKALLASLLAVIVTVFFGIYCLGDRKYYFISLLIILEILLPFALMFEKRKPKARELALISVLLAIVAMGRTVFFMVPQIKPALAIVIICGAALGAETGALVGAAGMFVSNFFFGQGPWTPWQMLAFSMAGMLAGLLFKSGNPKKLPLCVFGVFAAMLYGCIMNPATVIISGEAPTAELILSAFALGLPFDALHSFSTVVFLWLLAPVFIENLKYIQIRYGLI